MDQLVARGMKFSSAYANCPVCSLRTAASFTARGCASLHHAPAFTIGANRVDGDRSAHVCLGR
jgi:hypothetical protein